MINPAIVASADALRRSFEQATPFRHVVMEHFLDEAVMATLEAQFPPFEHRHALNEFGKVGGKAVVTDLTSVSPAYEQLYRYLNSREFLAAMSAITGIDNLLPDPQLYGGGTHENVEGQELDPHVDYNYINDGKLHRRLNLLLYFNREWDPAWGGCIELHANPRNPAADQVTSFAPLYNRALIFETNEHSWHGFKRIVLPEDRKGLSRRSLAIYLYTQTRPEAETAPPHGTFYVQRPLPESIRAGEVLGSEDLQEVRNLIKRRDDWIAFYQTRELEQSRRILDLEKQVTYLTSGPKSVVRLLVYYCLPLSVERKLRIKSWLFRHLPFLFRRTRAYRNWLAFENSLSKNTPDQNAG